MAARCVGVRCARNAGCVGIALGGGCMGSGGCAGSSGCTGSDGCMGSGGCAGAGCDACACFSLSVVLLFPPFFFCCMTRSNAGGAPPAAKSVLWPSGCAVAFFALTFCAAFSRTSRELDINGTLIAVRRDAGVTLDMRS